MKPAKSILRPSSYETCPTLYRLPGLVVSEESDDNESAMTMSRESSTASIPSNDCNEQLVLESPKHVTFARRVRVQEFVRCPGEEYTTWYTPSEMKAFYREAKGPSAGFSWFNFFCPPTLQPRSAVVTNHGNDAVASNGVRRILLVDSHDLSLHLFAKSFQKAFPEAMVLTASNSRDALGLCQGFKLGFDIIIVEERLGLFCNDTDCGSGLLKTIRESFPWHKQSLLIGVSAHLERDQTNLEKNGADFCWTKPPPPLDNATVDQILNRLAGKREGSA